jgi:hypothetical protein
MVRRISGRHAGTRAVCLVSKLEPLDSEQELHEESDRAPNALENSLLELRSTLGVTGQPAESSALVRQLRGPHLSRCP